MKKHKICKILLVILVVLLFMACYVHITQELRIRSRGTERHSASN